MRAAQPLQHGVQAAVFGVQHVRSDRQAMLALVLLYQRQTVVRVN
jgi:hypothetical protein